MTLEGELHELLRNKTSKPVEHQLTIPFGNSPDHPMDDQIRVMARTNVGAFEDEGYPEILEGSLIGVPDQLLQRVRNGETVLADLGGKTYRLARLEPGGEFELRKWQRP